MCIRDRHKDIDALSFTGSTAGGIEVGRLALSTVKKITLELGGKSPLVVLKLSLIHICSRRFATRWMKKREMYL